MQEAQIKLFKKWKRTNANIPYKPEFIDLEMLREIVKEAVDEKFRMEKEKQTKKSN